MKKYDSYKDSGIEWIGEIPEHWESIKLKYVLSIQSGKGITNEQFVENGEFEIYGGNGILGKTDSYTNEGLDIIIGRVGALCGNIRLVDGKKWISDNALLANTTQNHYFIEKCLKVLDLNRLANKNAQPLITGTMVKDQYIGLPSLEEQTQIANYLDHKTNQIDTLISKKQQFITLLQEERIAEINQAVTKGLDPKVKMKNSGIEWLGEIPEHWQVKKLKNIFSTGKGLTITKENLIDEGIPCVNYGEIHSKFGFELDTKIHKLKCVGFEYLDSDERSLIKFGDFVFADTSEDIAGAGNFTYLKSNEKTFAGYHTVILKPLEMIESRFFAFEFDSILFRTQIRQSVKGIKVFSITQSILKNVNVWIPPIMEQLQIINFLNIETDRIDTIISKTQQEIELLKEYKIALISEVVTGKVDVREEILN